MNDRSVLKVSQTTRDGLSPKYNDESGLTFRQFENNVLAAFDIAKFAVTNRGNFATVQFIADADHLALAV
jgi:hypothetical protein